MAYTQTIHKIILILCILVCSHTFLLFYCTCYCWLFDVLRVYLHNLIMLSGVIHTITSLWLSLATNCGNTLHIHLSLLSNEWLVNAPEAWTTVHVACQCLLYIIRKGKSYWECTMWVCVREEWHTHTRTHAHTHTHTHTWLLLLAAFQSTVQIALYKAY